MIVALGPGRSSWTAPLDALRLRPDHIVVVLDAGYDSGRRQLAACHMATNADQRQVIWHVTCHP